MCSAQKFPQDAVKGGGVIKGWCGVRGEKVDGWIVFHMCSSLNVFIALISLMPHTLYIVGKSLGNSLEILYLSVRLG